MEAQKRGSEPRGRRLGSSEQPSSHSGRRLVRGTGANVQLALIAGRMAGGWLALSLKAGTGQASCVELPQAAALLCRADALATPPSLPVKGSEASWPPYGPL